MPRGIAYPIAVYMVLIDLIKYLAVIEIVQSLTGYQNGDLYNWHSDETGPKQDDDLMTPSLCFTVT